MQTPTILRYVSILYRFSQIHMAKRLRPFGLGAGHYPLLLAVMRKPGIRQDGLAERLAMDKGTIAKAIRHLQKEGLLYRRIDLIDRRAYRLFATRKGKRLSLTLEAFLLEWQSLLYASLTGKERREAYRLTVAMAANAKQHVRADERRVAKTSRNRTANSSSSPRPAKKRISAAAPKPGRMTP